MGKEAAKIQKLLVVGVDIDPLFSTFLSVGFFSIIIKIYCLFSFLFLLLLWSPTGFENN